MIEMSKSCLEKLETLLAEGFSAEGNGLEAKVGSVGRELPDELRKSLIELSLAGAQTDGEGVGPMEFAFRCGQAYEQLASLSRERLAANIAFLGTDGSQPPELESRDFDALARFVAMRNRFLKTVADYTLKFLLVSVILLVIGLSLGLI